MKPIKNPAQVIRVGTDSSGRGIYMSRYMAHWWKAVKRKLSFVPIVIQGAHMTRNGGGASKSAGYHDKGGCLDIHTRTLSPAQKAELIRVLRQAGAAAWIRDMAHGGMDEHCHLVLGFDPSGMDEGAALQWRQYLAGLDGLASGGRDYHPRPAPVPTMPPASLFEVPKNPTQLMRAAVKTAIKHVKAADANRTRVKAQKQRLLKVLKSTPKK